MEERNFIKRCKIMATHPLKAPVLANPIVNRNQNMNIETIISEKLKGNVKIHLTHVRVILRI